jgi:hypothetical protein
MKVYPWFLDRWPRICPCQAAHEHGGQKSAPRQAGVGNSQLKENIEPIGRGGWIV